MRIEKLHIKGFRNFRDEEFLFQPQTLIIGANDVGKTKEFNSYEVKHVQELVEKHYWIFGEQYNLITSAEPDFELALKGMIKAEMGIEEEVHIEHPDKNKEMDLL